MSNDCTPLITPADCGDALAVPPPDPVPEAGPIPDLPPETPPVVDHLTNRVGDVTSPDLSHAADIAATSLVCGLVLIGMLILIVGVAALRPVEPHRLRNFAAAAWALPAVSVLTGGSWSTPLSLLWHGTEQLADGDITGLPMMLILGLPATLLAGSLWWAHFLIKTETVGLKSLRRTKRVQDAMTVRRSRAAARAAKFGAPLHRGHEIVLGTRADTVSYRALGMWRLLTAQHRHWLTVPHADAKKQMALLGTTGSGKTELIKRFSAALFDYEWRAWQRWSGVPAISAKHPRPLLAMISCKGGEDDREFGLQMREAMLAQGIGEQQIATVVPGMDHLDIFENTPARDLRAIIAALMSSGSQATTAEGQHFEEMQIRISHLVVDAPCGPPRNTTELLARLNPAKLKEIWNHAPDVVRQVDAMQEEKVPQVDDALIKTTNLVEQLKDHNGQVVFDGGKNIDDLDFLFMTVPALDKDASRAQVGATLRLLMQRAGRTAKRLRRSVILFIDELSALTTLKGSIGLEDIAERGRSQGVAVVFCGQAPESIAADAWALNRLLKTCAGGILLGYLENAGDLCKHFGSIPVMLPSRHLIKGQRHGDEGQVSVGEKWLVDPDRVRRFQTGEFVYAKAGFAQFGRVVILDKSQPTSLPGTTIAQPADGENPAPAAA